MRPPYKELVVDQGGKSAIREILKLTSKPDIISFAGGLPAPESFPSAETMSKLTSIALGRFPKALQYTTTEGFAPFRETLAEFVTRYGIQATPENVLVTTGSQQALYGLGKILIRPGDKVLVEDVTYLGALQAFSHQKPRYITVQTDENGVLPESLDAQLEQHPDIRFAYFIPTFQNPTGKTIPLDRRQQIAEIILRRRTLAIEDNPYGELRYEGNHLPTLFSLAPENVVYLGTMSKIFAPGLRLGYLVAQPEVCNEFATWKQGADLHTSTLNQALAAVYLEDGYFEKQLPQIIKLYEPRWRAMGTAIDESFPEGTKRSYPQGGMFFWVELPEGIDSTKLLDEALKRNVAFVPGTPFVIDEKRGKSCMRLNLTANNVEAIKTGIGILGTLVRDMMSR